MDVEVEIEGRTELASRLDGISKGLVDRGLLDELAGEAKKMVLLRASEGRDLKGDPFRPYSKGHAVRRKKKGLRTSRVDLRFTGRMLGSIATAALVARGEGKVFFRDGEAERRARYHDREGVGGARVKRVFFGLSMEEMRRLRGLVLRRASKVIKDAL